MDKNLNNILSALTGSVSKNSAAIRKLNTLEIGGAPETSSIVGGRLTLQSNYPVSTTDQTAKATLYYTPYTGNDISLYDTGTSKWVLYNSAQVSLSLAGYTADKPYDIFAYDNAGTLTLESVIWTNTSTRATALARQNGVYVKTGAVNKRYIGSILINAAGGQTENTDTQRFVDNYYNQVQTYLTCGISSAHTYNGAIRLWNNSSVNNKLESFTGVVEGSEIYSLYYRGEGVGGAYYSLVHLYRNGSSLGYVGTYTADTLIAARTYIDQPLLGLSLFQAYEVGNNDASTFRNIAINVATWK